MPRVSEAEKQKSRKRILDAAAKLIREQGIEATSVAEIMEAAGMTHGGFYRHFSNKDELISAAFLEAVDRSVRSMEVPDTDASPEEARNKYVATYLSREHVENRGVGCPLAALGAELVRSDGAARQEAAATVDRLAKLLSDGSDKQEGYEKLALLLGTVTLARLVDDPDQRQSILDAGVVAMDRA
ncbi:TetR/AcrR family transcriptional regulator [Thalassospira sp. HF15]|uniref:TetR/AcrR family transcriptional regulator n=1 Tax=Thalassospira sp. HF15 TaxID=2722755 RepID=UPI00143013B2|nr:TetR/AcrR family transcriptional regulator [Thalassospira sp. HF15]NIY76296.1 TetR/AcrR family transcriptional regulator [Thalassospira sp. HF15]